MKKIIYLFIFNIWHMYGLTPITYFSAALGEKDNGTIASSLISALPEDQKQGAIKRYNNRFKTTYQAPAAGDVKQSPEYIALQKSIQASTNFKTELSKANSDQAKIDALGTLFKNGTGKEVITTLKEKYKKTEDPALKTRIQETVNTIKSQFDDVLKP
jgi:hypothetical protein